ncbi:hypothetical protein FB451DRAFT_1272925 [Mycena latifolia]|nr:hypothetical protein FB451DRAFT_1272925 [Mycena latifolia]
MWRRMGGGTLMRRSTSRTRAMLWTRANPTRGTRRATSRRSRTRRTTRRGTPSHPRRTWRSTSLPLILPPSILPHRSISSQPPNRLRSSTRTRTPTTSTPPLGMRTRTPSTTRSRPRSRRSSGRTTRTPRPRPTHSTPSHKYRSKRSTRTRPCLWRGRGRGWRAQWRCTTRSRSPRTRGQGSCGSSSCSPCILSAPLSCPPLLIVILVFIILILSHRSCCPVMFSCIGFLLVHTLHLPLLLHLHAFAYTPPHLSPHASRFSSIIRPTLPIPAYPPILVATDGQRRLSYICIIITPPSTCI